MREGLRSVATAFAFPVTAVFGGLAFLGVLYGNFWTFAFGLAVSITSYRFISSQITD